MLVEVDRRFYGASGEPPDERAVVEGLFAYIEQELAKGTRLSHITRHLLGLFHGASGARRWRQILTVGAIRPDADLLIVSEALAAVAPHGDERHGIPHRMSEIPSQAVAVA
jgi:tRNA-dihydrouridine synthase A